MLNVYVVMLSAPYGRTGETHALLLTKRVVFFFLVIKKIKSFKRLHGEGTPFRRALRVMRTCPTSHRDRGVSRTDTHVRCPEPRQSRARRLVASLCQVHTGRLSLQLSQLHGETACPVRVRSENENACLLGLQGETGHPRDGLSKSPNSTA